MKYTDDVEVNGLTDDDAEAVQGNMGSLVSRMNMQLATGLIYSHAELCTWKNTVSKYGGEDGTFENTDFEKCL